MQPCCWSYSGRARPTGADPWGKRISSPFAPIGLDTPTFPRPPLTAGLFDEHLGGYASAYPSSRPAIVNLRPVAERGEGPPIEEAIAKLYEAASSDPERARHLLVLRFYLSDLVETEADHWWNLWHGFTHYAQLLERLGQWRAASGGR